MSVRTTGFAATALLLLSLAACSGGGGSDGSGTGSTEEPAEAVTGGGTSDCLSDRTWVLDLDDLAGQLGANLASNGMNVTQSEGEGRQDFRFNADGSATAHIDVTYTVTIQTDDLTLTLVQTHAGDPSGQWARSSGSNDITFSDWDNSGYSVQNQFLIDGVASESALNIPSEELGDGSVMTTDCSGDTLSTSVTGSPYTQQWTTSD